MRKWWLNGISLWSMAACAPEDGGGAGGAGDGGGAPAVGAGDGTSENPGSVLFPNEGKTGDAPADGTKPGDGKTEEGAGKTEVVAWKPYVDDPAKSKEENDKARAENELGNPDNPVNKVPDDGKYTFAMPEGMQLDEKLAVAVSPVMKEIGLTRGQAQKLADVLADQRKAEGEAFAKSAAGRQFMAMNAYGKNYGQPDQWSQMAEKDAEIGGEKWNGSVEVAQRALAKFGTPALRDFLMVSGGGNHPEVIRFMTRVGNAISDDKPAHGDGGSGQPAEAAYVLFPDDKPKG